MKHQHACDPPQHPQHPFLLGGSITFEDRNVHNNGSSLSATIDAPNFLQPGEDLGFRLEYKRPYIYGDRDRKKTAMTVSAFNVRKQSAVYKSGACLCKQHGTEMQGTCRP